jgi:hypothetical protein
MIGPLLTTLEAVAIVTVSTLAVMVLIFCAVVIIDAATGAFFNRKRYDEASTDKTDTSSNGVDPW